MCLDVDNLPTHGGFECLRIGMSDGCSSATSPFGDELSEVLGGEELPTQIEIHQCPPDRLGRLGPGVFLELLETARPGLGGVQQPNEIESLPSRLLQVSVGRPRSTPTSSGGEEGELAPEPSQAAENYDPIAEQIGLPPFEGELPEGFGPSHDALYRSEGMIDDVLYIFEEVERNEYLLTATPVP